MELGFTFLQNQNPNLSSLNFCQCKNIFLPSKKWGKAFKFPRNLTTRLDRSPPNKRVSLDFSDGEWRWAVLVQYCALLPLDNPNFKTDYKAENTYYDPCHPLCSLFFFFFFFASNMSAQLHYIFYQKPSFFLQILFLYFLDGKELSFSPFVLILWDLLNVMLTREDAKLSHLCICFSSNKWRRSFPVTSRI